MKLSITLGTRTEREREKGQSSVERGIREENGMG